MVREGEVVTTSDALLRRWAETGPFLYDTEECMTCGVGLYWPHQNREHSSGCLWRVTVEHVASLGG